LFFFGDKRRGDDFGEKQFCYEEGLHVPLLIRWPKEIDQPEKYGGGIVDDRLVAAIDLAPTMLALVGASVPEKMQGRVFLGKNAAPPREYVFRRPRSLR
jgi:arylsulfatase A-like enzyme